MAGGVNILHLTDFHFGQDVPLVRWERLLDALAIDLEHVTRDAGKVDAVVLTGDIANHGAPGDFELASDQLDRLFRRLSADHAPPVIAIPGNHDVERSEGSPLTDLSLEAPSAFGAGVDDALKRKAGDYLSPLRQAFANFQRWTESCAAIIEPTCAGPLPGDGVYRLKANGLVVDFLALNTSYAQLGKGDYEGRLHVSPQQIDLLYERYAELLSSREPDLALLLTHHPLEWLTEASAGDVRELVLGGRGRIVSHLFGHRHERHLSAVTSTGVDHRLYVQGASFFGLETFGKERVKRIHGYSVLSFQQRGDEVVGRVAPRQGYAGSDGAWQFDRDLASGLNLEKGADWSSEVVLLKGDHPEDRVVDPPTRGDETKAAAHEDDLEGLTQTLRLVAEELRGAAPPVTNSVWDDPRDEGDVVGSMLAVLREQLSGGVTLSTAECMLAGSSWLLTRALRRIALAGMPPFQDWLKSPSWAREVAALSTIRERLIARARLAESDDEKMIADWLQRATVSTSDRPWRLPETKAVSTRIASAIETRADEVQVISEVLTRLSRQGATGRIAETPAIARLMSAGLAPPGTSSIQFARHEVIEPLAVVLEAMTFDPGIDGSELVEQIGLAPDFDIASAMGELWATQWAVVPEGDFALVARSSDPAVELVVRATVERLRGRAEDVGSNGGGAALREHVINRARTDRITPKVINGEPAYESPVPRLTMNTERMRELLMGEQLYGDARLALREVYQNALDACRYRERREQYLSAEDGPRSWEGRIDITFRSDSDGRQSYLECLDNGVGMDKRKLVNSFLRAGERFVESPEFVDEQIRWRERNPDATLIPNSTFGIGVYSYFMIADRVEVLSRPQSEDGRLGSPIRLNLIAGSTIARVSPADEACPELAGGGTLVRLYLRDEYASGARLTVREFMDQIVWCSPYALTVTEPAETVQRRPKELSSAAPHGRDLAFDDGECAAWWSQQDGRLLVDGIASPVPLVGLIANLHGERKPVLRVDRNTVLSWDEDWLLKRLQSCGESLASWPGLSLAWLWRISEAYPTLGDTLAQEVAKRRPRVPLGLSREWSAEVDIRRVGCFPADRYLISVLDDRLRVATAYPEIPVPAAKQRERSFSFGPTIRFPTCLVPWRRSVWRTELPDLFEDRPERVYGLNSPRERPICEPVAPDRSFVPDAIDAALLASQPSNSWDEFRFRDFGCEEPVDLAALVFGAHRCGLSIGEAVARLWRFTEVGLRGLPSVRDDAVEHAPSLADCLVIGALGPRFDSRKRVSRSDLLEILPLCHEGRATVGEGINHALQLLRSLGVGVPRLALGDQLEEHVPTEREVKFFSFNYYRGIGEIRDDKATRAMVLRGSRRAEIHDPDEVRRLLRLYKPMGLGGLAGRFRYPDLSRFSEDQRIAWSEEFDGRPSWVDEDVFRRGFISSARPKRAELVGHALFYSAFSGEGFRTALRRVFEFPGLGVELDWDIDSVQDRPIDEIDLKLLTRRIGSNSRYSSNRFEGIGQQELLRRRPSPYEIVLGAEAAGVSLDEAFERLGRFEILGVVLPNIDPSTIAAREITPVELKVVTTQSSRFAADADISHFPDDPPRPIEGPIPGVHLFLTAREERCTLGEIWRLMEGLRDVGFEAGVQAPPEHLVKFAPTGLDARLAQDIDLESLGLTLCLASSATSRSIGYLCDLCEPWASWVFGEHEEALVERLDLLRNSSISERTADYRLCVTLAALRHSADKKVASTLRLVEMAAEMHVSVAAAVKQAEELTPLLEVDGISPLDPVPAVAELGEIPSWQLLFQLGIGRNTGAGAAVQRRLLKEHLGADLRSNGTVRVLRRASDAHG